jgi:hypothetical protein
MIQQPRGQRNLTAVLRLESLLQSTHQWRTHARPVGEGSAVTGGDSDPGDELASLLASLGVPAGTSAAARFGHNHAATAHAVVVIKGWIRYLPSDCVRAMVADGWHWST